jgi:hypothetical protein
MPTVITKKGGNKHMPEKRFRPKNKIQALLPEQTARFLDQERAETGNTKASIIRKALNEYMNKRLSERLKTADKAKMEELLNKP